MPTIIILRERQLLLRVLKLYIVVNGTRHYLLQEQQPLILEKEQLPVNLVAKNGFHFSKPFYISQAGTDPVLIGVGCEADNGRFWGGIVFSILFFAIFFATGFYPVLVLANLPLLYLVYKYFIKPNEFITIEILKK